MGFEIVRGDYGTVYRGILVDEDYSLYTAVANVWDEDDTKVVENAVCSVSKVGDDTYIDFTPTIGDFDVDPDKRYYGNFKLSKAGAVERTIKFEWNVLHKEP